MTTNVEKLNASISKDVDKAINNILNEHIKTDGGDTFHAWDSKSALVTFLLKVGLIHYRTARAKDRGGVIL